MTQLNMGTIVSWEAPKEVSFADLQSAVVAAGFDSKYAREMAARNAFSRTARELSEQRVIRRVDEDDSEIQFQFTKEYMAANEYKYETECMLWLNKEHGTVRVDDSNMQELADQAYKLVLEHQGKRNQSDVTRMIQKIFDDRKGDLVPLRRNGGVYFVPDTHKELVEQVYRLVIAIGGSLNRFVISFGDSNTQVSVAQAMADHLLDQIEQFRETCKGISSETSTAVLVRRTEVISDMRNKLESYQALLAGFHDSIESEITSAEQEIYQAVMNVESPATEPETVSV